MKKLILSVVMVMTLFGCADRKEKLAFEKTTKECVVVVLIEQHYTYDSNGSDSIMDRYLNNWALLETVKDRQRFSRVGVYGKPGDRFKMYVTKDISGEIIEEEKN